MIIWLKFNVMITFLKWELSSLDTHPIYIFEFFFMTGEKTNKKKSRRKLTKAFDNSLPLALASSRKSQRSRGMLNISAVAHLVKF